MHEEFQVLTIITWHFKFNSLPFLDGKCKGKRCIMTGWGINIEKILIQLVNVSDRAFSGSKLIRQ